MNILIESIGNTSEARQANTRKDQIKLFVIIAEVYQHQILNFLGRITGILNLKIVQAEEGLGDILASTYSSVVTNALRQSEQGEQKTILEEIFRNIFEIEKPNPHSLIFMYRVVGSLVKQLGGEIISSLQGMLISNILKTEGEA